MEHTVGTFAPLPLQTSIVPFANMLSIEERAQILSKCRSIEKYRLVKEFIRKRYGYHVSITAATEFVRLLENMEQNIIPVAEGMIYCYKHVGYGCECVLKHNKAFVMNGFVWDYEPEFDLNTLMHVKRID